MVALESVEELGSEAVVPSDEETNIKPIVHITAN